MITLSDNYRVLVVDDEPDVYTLTQLALKNLRYENIPVKIEKAMNGKEAVEQMRSHPDTAVVLLDVVMETQSAGLDTCRFIREDLKNTFTRIILRTGQPGAAPERKVIEEYDIDGYLPKEDLTATKLYTSVRTAIKAFTELIELERHRDILGILNNLASSLHSFESLEISLDRILKTAIDICPSPFAVLNLNTFEKEGEPNNFLFYTSADSNTEKAQRAAGDIVSKVSANPSAKSLQDSGAFDKGYIVPITLHRSLGYGWLYLESNITDNLILQSLPLLASHASNALYSNIAQKMLSEREGPYYESITI